MKFVTFAALTLASTSAKSGVLNVNWVDDMVCPDSLNLDNLVEVVLDTEGTSDLSYDNYRQKCAEAFYGFDSEEVPCLQAVMFPTLSFPQEGVPFTVTPG